MSVLEYELEYRRNSDTSGRLYCAVELAKVDTGRKGRHAFMNVGREPRVTTCLIPLLHTQIIYGEQG